MKQSSLVAVVVLVSALGLGIAHAGITDSSNAPSGPDKAFWEQQKAENKAHVEAQKAENEAFRATLKDKKDEEKESLIQAHRAKQMQENKNFRAQQHAESMAHIQASDMPADKKAETIKALQDKWAAAEAKHAEKAANRKASHEAKKKCADSTEQK